MINIAKEKHLNWFKLFSGKITMLALMFFYIQPAFASPDGENWQRWTEHNESSTKVVDHSVWNNILKKYVETDNYGQNLFNYSAMTPDDNLALKNYIDMLSRVQVQDLNRNEQLAFWINAYNAIIVDIILDAYPVDNILDIGGDLFTRGPWKIKHFHIGGSTLNILEIQEHIIFANWADLRVIYTLSCGAVGCPNIGTKAVSGKHLNGYLEAATLAFINGPKAVFEIDDSNIKISKYYYWRKHQFEKNQVNILDHLKGNAMEPLSQRLENAWYIGGYQFNWELNEVKVN